MDEAYAAIFFSAIICNYPSQKERELYYCFYYVFDLKIFRNYLSCRKLIYSSTQLDKIFKVVIKTAHSIVILSPLTQRPHQMNSIQDKLRQKAEAILSKVGNDATSMSTDAIQELLYEFQLHQLELELQNQELRQAQHELKIARDHYAQFYNLLPVAYLCLNTKLEQKNQTQTQLLMESNQEILTTINEINSYKRQLTEHEEMLNAIFNSAMEGIITIFVSGVIVFVNEAVEKIFAYKKEELLCNNINLLIPDLNYKKQANYYWDSVDTPSCDTGNICEVTGLRKDGTALPLDISIAHFSIDGNNFLTCIVRDITDRKIREQLDQEHLDELAHVSRLGLMGEMASGIAHEVNQPLTAIANYSQACLNLLRKKDLDKGKLSDLLQKNKQQALNAGQIINRMRDFTRYREMQRSTVDLNTLIHEAISLCDSYLKQNGISMRLQLAENLPLLKIDSIQIEQVILNLIRNSIEALKNIPDLKRLISIQTVMHNDSVVETRIIDNGPGIEEQYQQKIFTPFYTSKDSGMGLGLLICRSIVEAHQGVLRFNSQRNKTTTFYFTLPISA